MSVADDRPWLAGQLRVVEALADSLEPHVEALARKLAPVLKPPAPAPGPQSARPDFPLVIPPWSPMAARLDAVGWRLAEITRALIDLTDRVDC